MLSGEKTYAEVKACLAEVISEFKEEELEHALTYLQPVKRDGDTLRLDVTMDDQFLEYTEALIEYGLIRYVIDNGDETGFKLWQNYRMDQAHLDKLNASKFAHVFIRKVSTENGLVLPFTYIGKGELSSPRRTEGSNGTYLFDIHMENALPEYLQYDFGLSL